MTRNNKEKARRLAGEAFWVSFGMVLTMLAGFVGVRLLTEVMSPDEYGKLGLAMSISMALQYSLAMSMNTSAARFYTVAKENRIFGWYWRLLAKTGIWIFMGSSLISILLFIVLYATGRNENAWIYSLSFLLGGLIVMSGIGTGIQSGARNRRAVCWNQNLFSWGRFIFAFILTALFSGTAVYALAGFILAMFFMLASQYFFVRKDIFPLIQLEGETDRDDSSVFFSYLRPLLISGVFIWIQLFAVRWVLHLFGSLAAVGGYFAYYQIGFMTMLIGGSVLMRFLTPIFFDHAGDGSDQKAQLQVCAVNGKISVCMLIFVLISFLAVLLLNPFLARILVSSSYRNDAWMLPWLVLSGGLYAVSRQLLLSLYSGMESRKIIPISFLGGGLSLVLSLAGGWFGGIPGIIFSGVCFSVIYTVLAWRLHVREVCAKPAEPGRSVTSIPAENY
jgi:O-antigen/teichoic acid export membrane protein